MFNVFMVFLNHPLLSLLPDFIQTPLERSFRAWLHKGWRELNGGGPFVKTTTTCTPEKGRGRPADTHTHTRGEQVKHGIRYLRHDRITCVPAAE